MTTRRDDCKRRMLRELESRLFHAWPTADDVMKIKVGTAAEAEPVTRLRSDAALSDIAGAR